MAYDRSHLVVTPEMNNKDQHLRPAGESANRD